MSSLLPLCSIRRVPARLRLQANLVEKTRSSHAATIGHVIDTGFDWTLAPLVWLLLLGGMLLSTEVGRRLRVKHLRAEQGEAKGFGAVQGAVFGLMGLVMAFTFSGAASRFDHRRDLVVEEANNIGTAYLRIALLPEAARAPLQDKFREYMDSRLQAYRDVTDAARITQLLQQTAQHQDQIWKMAVEAIGHASSPPVAALILPSLNDMSTSSPRARQPHRCTHRPSCG